MPNYTQTASVSSILENVVGAIGLLPSSLYLGSTDLTITQLVKLFTQTGKTLAAAHDWQQLHTEWELTTTTDTEYPLPEDFNGFVNGAQWDNTQRWPMVGSISPQIWRMLQARLSGGEWAMIAYKIQDGNLVLFNTPSSGSEYVLDYYSAGWLRKSDDPSVRYDNPQADSDVCLLDSLLMEYATELSWRGAKGFDTASIADKFTARWDTIVGRDAPAPTLSVGPRRMDGLLGYYNIPDTGYGS